MAGADRLKYEIVSPRVGKPGSVFVPTEGVNLDALLENGFIKVSKPKKDADPKIGTDKE